MSSYRLYFVDESGHIHTAAEFKAASDAAALDACRSLIHGQRAELWSTSRLVKRIGPGAWGTAPLNL